MVSAANVPTGEIYLDLRFAEKMVYINDNGKTVAASLIMVLVHELLHAIRGTVDNTKALLANQLEDYKQETVVAANKIYEEINSLMDKDPKMETSIQLQNSYLGQGVTDPYYASKLSPIVLEPDKDYTHGAKIDRSVARDSDWDSSHGGQQNDLLIGGDSNNTLKAGEGNDWLYGGLGNDNLYGDSGNDFLFGEKDNDYLDGGEGKDLLDGGRGSNTLIGGTGFDTYVVGEGGDTIIDIDGLGKVLLKKDLGNVNPNKLSEQTDHLKGGEYDPESKTYKDLLNKGISYVWHLKEGEKIADLDILDKNGMLLATIKDFRNGALNINLIDKNEPENPGAIDQAQNTTPPYRDPLVLDLNGNGFNITNPKGWHTMFDHDGSGLRYGTGWVAPDDGLLVFDRNGNKIIDDGTELFGDQTIKYDLSGRCADGIEALAQEDTNGDGVINYQDANWYNLKVWRDLNQDGINQSNELFTLNNLGITEFNLERTETIKKFLGGTLSSTISFTKNGQDHQAGNFFFKTSTYKREFTEDLEVPDDILASIPNVTASGRVRDLQEARLQSPELKELILNFSQAELRADRKALLEEILVVWSETGGLVKNIEERFPGRYEVNFVSVKDFSLKYPSHSQQMLLDKLKHMLNVLEAFNGRYFYVLPEDLAPGETLPWYIKSQPREGQPTLLNIENTLRQYEMIEKAYDSISDHIYGQLIFHIRLSPFLNKIKVDFNTETQQVSYDYTALNNYFQQELQRDPYHILPYLAEFQQYMVPKLPPGNWDGKQILYNLITQDNLIYDLLINSENTPEIRKLFEEMGIKIVGGINYGSVSGSEQDDIIWAGSNTHELRGQAGNDILVGGHQNETLYGGDGNDILHGGAGNDNLYGGTGNDTYYFGPGSGHDIIYENDSNPNRHDTVCLNVNPEDIKVSTNSIGSSLVFTILATGETLTINGALNNPYLYGIQSFKFANGQILDSKTLLKNGLHGTEGCDRINLLNWTPGTIYAGGGDDYIQLAKGDSTIYGGDGNDKIIVDGDHNIVYGESGNDWLYSGAGGDKLYGGAGDDKLYGEVDNDKLYGDAGDDYLDGGAGDDYLHGGDGANILDGGTGNDTLYGGSGSNTFIFGQGYGQDVITNSKADLNNKILLKDLNPTDISVALKGKGIYDLILTIKSTGESLTVKTFVSPPDWKPNLNQFEFADGQIWNGYQLLTELLVDNINDFTQAIKIPDTGEIRTEGASNSDNWLIFGSRGDDLVIGNSGNNILSGGAGNDYLRGEQGNDTYLFTRGSGHDIVNTQAAFSKNNMGRDVIHLIGLNANEVDIYFEWTGKNTSYSSNVILDLIFKIKDTGETIKVHDPFGITDIFSTYTTFHGFRFDNGLLTTFEELMIQGLPIIGSNGLTGFYQKDTLILNGGSDSENLITYFNGSYANINGGDGDDIIRDNTATRIISGGRGNDTIYGSGNQKTEATYLFNRGDGQDLISGEYYGVVQFGADIDLDDVYWECSVKDLIIKFHNSSDQITFVNFFGSNKEDQTLSLKFNDGTVIDTNELASFPILAGTNDSDNLYGWRGDDILYGYAGDDVLSGLSGNDTLYGGAGNDTLYGKDGNDYLEGGSDNDNLYGGNGADTYSFNLGDGQDVIVDSYDEANKILFGSGIIANDLIFKRTQHENYTYDHKGNEIRQNEPGSNLIIQIKGSTDQLTINNFFYGDNNQQHKLFLEFSNGQSLEITGLNAIPFSPTTGNDFLLGNGEDNNIDGLGGSDIIYGFEGNDILYGEAGNDFLYGGGGNDKLYGGNDNDALFGGLGDDELYGGAGNDYLSDTEGNNYFDGGAGNDIYKLQLNSNQQIIDNNGGGYDSLSISTFYASPEYFWFERQNDNLIITNTQTSYKNASITVNDWFSQPNKQLDEINVGWNVLLENQMQQLINAMAAYNGYSDFYHNTTWEEQQNMNNFINSCWKSI